MVYKGRIILRPTPISRKVSGYLKKMFGMYKPHRNKDPFMNQTRNDNLPTGGIPTFISNSVGLNRTQITRRQIVLNRHFTEIISDVIATTYHHRFTKMGVTISSIESKAWNKGVNIFYTSDNAYDKTLHDELNGLIGQMKLSIAERGLIGRVPPINFLRDRSDLMEKALNLAMNNMEPPKPETTNQVMKMQLGSITRSQSTEGAESTPEAKSFEQPLDMVNCLFGLNYPDLYNRVVTKLERGRAVSSRMTPVSDLAPIKPFFREPEPKDDQEMDPMTRIINMKKFIVSRRKKADYQAKLRRKAILLDRDQYKWDLPGEDHEEYDPELDDEKAQ